MLKLVGKIKDAHGLKGELSVLVFSGEVSWLKQLKTCGIKTRAQAEPQVMKVERVKPFKQGLLLKTADIQDRTQAESFKGAEFWIEEELLVSKKGETIYLGEILNFKLKDKESVLGLVAGFSSNGAQDLLVIEKADGKTFEVPFVEDLIKKIDWKNQILVMDLPEGLADLEKL